MWISLFMISGTKIKKRHKKTYPNIKNISKLLVNK